MNQIKRLELHLETLRQLADSESKEAVGGIWGYSLICHTQVQAGEDRCLDLTIA
jgi:sporulation-control protein spo0M